MYLAVELSGPRSPRTDTPDRAPGSARRTTTIDLHPVGDAGGPAVLDAHARDLATGLDGNAAVVGDARLRGRVDEGRVLASLAADGVGAPRPAQLAGLVGASAAAGFRRLLADVLDDEVDGKVDAGSPWHLLLDDLVGATLVAGVAQQHVEVRAGGGPLSDSVRLHADHMLTYQADICAGWASDASMLREFRRVGDLPAQLGPEVPDLLRPDDPLAWHPLEPLGPHGVRRRRRLDVSAADERGHATFDVHFRDSHADEHRVERGVHEYDVRGTLDVAERRIVDLRCEARVLPWQECPGAVASAQRVVGLTLGEVRDHVRRELRGVSTCTHLNDVLRSLADLDALLALTG